MNVAMLCTNDTHPQGARAMLEGAGHVCRAYPFLSTFMTGAVQQPTDLAVVSWAISGPRTLELIMRLRTQLGWDVPVLVVDVPPRAPMDNPACRLDGVTCVATGIDPWGLSKAVKSLTAGAQVYAGATPAFARYG